MAGPVPAGAAGGLTDEIGLYMAPPETALVLCVDEKSQIPGLERTAPCLPMLPTTPARMTHDYVRNGTTSLFAALDLASGSVIAQPYRRHRHHEFLRFLKLIDAAVPKEPGLAPAASLCGPWHHSGLGSQRNRLIATKPPASPQIARTSSWWPANPRSSANGFSNAWLNGRTGKTPARSLRNREVIWK